MLLRLNVAFDVQANDVPLQGSIISVRRNVIKTAVTPEVHRELLEVPEGEPALYSSQHS